jgi:DNA invertase Pin-like site-specific DNA recombinase
MPSADFSQIDLGGRRQENIDTTTPTGRLLYQITGAFAEFERSIIRSRVNLGLARARAQGKRLGRRPVSIDVVERIRAQLATGAGILKTAKVLGIGTGTVHRVKQEMAAIQHPEKGRTWVVEVRSRPEGSPGPR